MKNRIYCDPNLDPQIPKPLGILIAMVLGSACWGLFALIIWVWVSG